MEIEPSSEVVAEPREFNTGIRTKGGAEPVVLLVIYGGLTNRALTQAYTKQANARSARRAGGVTPDSISAELVDDAKLFAAYVIKGWRNATEPDGTPAAATQDKYREFLVGVANSTRKDVISALRAFINNPDYFVGELGDPAVLGK